MMRTRASELNEADVDLLDEEDAEKLGPADGKKSKEWRSK